MYACKCDICFKSSISSQYYRFDFVFLKEQYKTIFLALEEEFKACIDTHNLSEFLESVNNLSADIPANQTFIYTEFEVRRLIAYPMFILKHDMYTNKLN